MQRIALWIVDENVSRFARLFNFVIIFAIVVSIGAWILETNHDANLLWGKLLHEIEDICMVFFIVEYILRALADKDGFWRYPFRTMAVIDALAILPFFISGTGNTSVLRVFRLFRIFRIFKFARYSESIHRLVHVFKLNRSILGAFLFLIFVILMLSASLMNTLEPDKFSQLTDALWWSIVTLTTVGYGDIVPGTLAGKVVAAILMIFGIGIIALPTGVLGASMTQLMMEEKNTVATVCPRCGETKHLKEARFCHRCAEKLKP